MSQAISGQASGERLKIHNLVRTEQRAGLAEDVRAGLSSSPKRLFPKYFYDALGSQLFEAICLLPEYYLTRAEHQILAAHAPEAVTEAKGDAISPMEIGSG